MRHSILLALLLSTSITMIAQKPQKLSSNQIYEKVQKLNFLGSVLYVAAHPDDENTRLISYLSNEVKANTTYLSLTRGDGGQNLIGPEIRESLGVIRTQELLAARAIDGGSQLFSRANDFGYSKHPDETLEIWNEEEVLSDVVWAIRNVKPDVIINRFDHRTPGSTHGHHTASAILSDRAFELAADKNSYSSQLDLVDTWKAKRLFLNTSSWFYKSTEAFEKAMKDGVFSFDVGVYYPLKGLSNNEVAAMASSQHLCQGFGRLSTRGSQKEYLEFLKGDFPKDKEDLFSGINTTWTRVKGGKQIMKLLTEVEQNFNFVNPATHLPQLLEASVLIEKLEDTHWKTLKQKEIKDIIQAAAGLYIEVSSTMSSTSPNSKVGLEFEVLNRNEHTAILKGYSFKGNGKSVYKVKNEVLVNNKKTAFKEELTIGAHRYSDPYWLRETASLGMYTVKEQALRGQPETERPVQVVFDFEILKHKISFTKDVVYRYAKRDKGELYEPFEILPKATVRLSENVVLFDSDQSKEIEVTVLAGTNNISGTVEICYPKGWSISPKNKPFNIAQKGDEITATFKVTPPKNASEGSIAGLIRIDGEVYTKELVEINYDHIPKQTILKPSETKVVKLNIEKKGTNIGYIQGAGDVIPESLAQIGYAVEIIKAEEINLEKLKTFDAVVVGIRAYNTIDILKFKQKFLLAYVKEGGTMVVQYNTSGRSGVDVMAPYTLNVSRDRVTNEFAEVRILDKKHSLLNYPNKITKKDFEGWVQERGLYFPNKWSKEYVPILSMNDKGESAKEGSLLIAQYGKGHYIYTGLSFFRELPAGVPGAYKLFANMLSVGK
ncbi:PIG-L family deacetylase [Flavicella sediminum]|uniref:PIG-L family deacetylase n=1 Tax=Flavicella sediminum TaxID=2585141 RepID=UPI00112396FE|nr:PIG-L family deacetylase [Flavicella sediminum]